MSETPDTHPIYVDKYYTVNRDEETLLFDGSYLKDGIPAEMNSSAWKQKIEEEVFDTIATVLAEPKRTVEAQTRAISRIMKLIGEIISEAQFDCAYTYHGLSDNAQGEIVRLVAEGMIANNIDLEETLKPYMKKDVEATTAMFSKLSGLKSVRPHGIDFDGDRLPCGHLWVDPPATGKFDLGLISRHLADRYKGDIKSTDEASEALRSKLSETPKPVGLEDRSDKCFYCSYSRCEEAKDRPTKSCSCCQGNH